LIDLTTGLPDGEGYYSFSVIGASGAAYADDHHNTHLVFGGGAPRVRFSEIEEAALAIEFDEFLAVAREQRRPEAGVASGRDTLSVAAAVRSSLESGQVAREAGGRYELG
ncbi:MAG: hypothetical protein AAF488_20155, partial [Planctomycetota bacterium]